MFEIDDIFEIKATSDDQEKEWLDLLTISNFTLQQSSQNQIKIQINFVSPTEVSQNIQEPDKLQVEFKISDIFMDQEDFTILDLDDNVQFSFPIPPQVPVEQYAIC